MCSTLQNGLKILPLCANRPVSMVAGRWLGDGFVTCSICKEGHGLMGMLTTHPHYDNHILKLNGMGHSGWSLT